MIEPTYVEYAPRAALRDYVHCLWSFSAPADEAPQPIAPDGRPELIVHMRKSYDEVREGGAKQTQAPVIFAGQLTRPLTLAARADVWVFGVRFRPDGARGFLGFDLDAATDKRIDLAAEHGDATTALRSALWDESHVEPRLGLIEDYVEARIAASGRDVDPIVRAVVTRLLAGEAAPTDLSISERQLQRRFRAEVGVSPRELQSVLRFRRVFDAIDAPGPAGWVEAALAAGYFDQPQMARDFRRYLGVSSRQWAQQRAGLAKALTTSESYKKRRQD